jgi:hypothetical protein
MTEPLSPEEMRALVQEHSDGEMAHDWPRAIATMTDAPVYEFYPYRIRISGSAAVTEAWKRLLPLPCFNSGEGGEFFGHEEYVGKDSLLHVSEWSFLDLDGVSHRTKVAVRYGFSDGRLESETMWMDSSMTPFVDVAFDDAFRLGPGVESI